MNMDPSTPDHDLLIELRTEVKGLRDDFKDMADNTKERITRLEETKLDKQAFTDFVADYKESKKETEDSVSFLTKWFWIAWGGVTVIQIILGYYIVIHYR